MKKLISFTEWIKLKEVGAPGGSVGAIVGGCKDTADYQVAGACSDTPHPRKEFMPGKRRKFMDKDGKKQRMG